MNEPIFHIAERSFWEEAVEAGEYRRSTRGVDLDQVGFIHCSWRHQVERIANAYYRDAGPLLLLCIDVHSVDLLIKVESGGGAELFPHLYGPLPADAVASVDPLEPAAGGLFVPRVSWLSPHLAVRPSPIHGVGLFAASPIQPGEVVAVMGGRVLTDPEFADHVTTVDRWSAAAVAEGLNVLQDEEDPLTRGNHSCYPNLSMADELSLVARRAISPGQEATVDYAVMTVDESWSMDCSCGSDACRGTIRGSDWRRPDLQDRYRGGFSPFIQRRIAGQEG